MTQIQPCADAGTVRDRAFRGAKVLAMRTAVSQLIRIGSSIVVARALSPEDFGVFAILIYISGFGIYIQSMGLDSALMQRDKAPNATDWRTAFLAQFIVAFAYTALIFLLGNWLLELFGASPHYFILLMISTAQPLLASLSFIPRNLLTRELEFSKIATASIANDVVQAVLSCVLALSGYGIWTLVIAPTAGILVSTLMLNWFSPFSPFGPVSFRCLIPLLQIGVPIQLAAATPALLNGWLPFFAGRMLGPSSLGAINLSQRIAGMPAGYLQILNQVAFPVFSRLQSDKQQLISSLVAGIYRFSVVGCIGYLIIAPWLPELVVAIYGPQWETAGLMLQFLGMSTLITALSNVLGSALCALGYGWLRLISLIISCGLPWIVAPILIGSLGVGGVGAAIVLFASVELVIVEICLAWKIMPSGELRRIVLAVVALFTLGTILLALSGEQSLHAKILVTSIGVVSMVTLCWRENRIGIEPTLPWFFRRLRSKAGAQPG